MEVNNEIFLCLSEKDEIFIIYINDKARKTNNKPLIAQFSNGLHILIVYLVILWQSCQLKTSFYYTEEKVRITISNTFFLINVNFEIFLKYRVFLFLWTNMANKKLHMPIVSRPLVTL